MTVATLTSKGQVTIPADVRRACGLTTGSQVDFVWVDATTVVMHTDVPSLDRLYGSLPANGVHLDLTDFDDALGRAVEAAQ